jgi:hypothetical protein
LRPSEMACPYAASAEAPSPTSKSSSHLSIRREYRLAFIEHPGRASSAAWAVLIWYGTTATRAGGIPVEAARSWYRFNSDDANPRTSKAWVGLLADALDLGPLPSAEQQLGRISE